MKISHYLMPLLLIGTTLTVLSGEPRHTSMKENQPILILQDQSEIPDAPRAPSFNPFFAELVDSTNSVALGATSPVGTVLVHITSTAGDDNSMYFNTSNGAIMIPISGNPGDYVLTIILPNGTHYIGEFTI